MIHGIAYWFCSAYFELKLNCITAYHCMIAVYQLIVPCKLWISTGFRSTDNGNITEQNMWQHIARNSWKQIKLIVKIFQKKLAYLVSCLVYLIICCTRTRTIEWCNTCQCYLFKTLWAIRYCFYGGFILVLEPFTDLNTAVI